MTKIENRVGHKDDPLTIEDMRDELCLRYERMHERGAGGDDDDYEEEEEKAAQMRYDTVHFGTIGWTPRTSSNKIQLLKVATVRRGFIMVTTAINAAAGYMSPPALLVVR